MKGGKNVSDKLIQECRRIFMKTFLELIEVIVCFLAIGFCISSAIWIACLFATAVFNMIF